MKKQIIEQLEFINKKIEETNQKMKSEIKPTQHEMIVGAIITFSALIMIGTFFFH